MHPIGVAKVMLINLWRLTYYAIHFLPPDVLLRTIPDVNSHGCRCDSINDHVPGIGYRVAALTAPGGRHANPWMLQNKIQRLIYPITHKVRRAPVLVGDMRQSSKIGPQRPWRPFKPLGGVCGHERRL